MGLCLLPMGPSCSARQGEEAELGAEVRSCGSLWLRATVSQKTPLWLWGQDRALPGSAWESAHKLQGRGRYALVT